MTAVRHVASLQKRSLQDLPLVIACACVDISCTQFLRGRPCFAGTHCSTLSTVPGLKTNLRAKSPSGRRAKLPKNNSWRRNNILCKLCAPSCWRTYLLLILLIHVCKDNRKSPVSRTVLVDPKTLPPFNKPDDSLLEPAVLMSCSCGE